MRRVGLISALLVLLVGAGGCAVDNPSYCSSDEQCRDPARETHDPSRPYCHPSKHYCFEGCATDQDCRNPDNRMYEAGKSFCNPNTHYCQDLGAPLELGQDCFTSSQCKSGHCASWVCCESECVGTCKSCNLSGSRGACLNVPSGQEHASCAPSGAECGGTCDGQGGCVFDAKVGKTCGTPSCKDGALTSSKCDAQGGCVGTPVTCGGFACSDDGKSCRQSCSSPTQCTSGFFCDAGVCRGNLELGKSCGTNNNACTSGKCTDGVCCEQASCGECKTCGAGGKCENLPDGPAAGHCKGDAGCAGKCEKGTCNYPEMTTICKTTCASGSQTTFNCDLSHACVLNKTDPCGAYLCNGTTACFTGCKDHAQCVSGSVCDRSKAHADAKGFGVCVDPTKVVLVSSGSIQTAVSNAVSSGKTHIRLGGGPYTEAQNVSLTSGTMAIIGDGAPIVTSAIGAPAGDANVFAVRNTASLTLQGLTLSSAKEDGVNCYSAAAAASLGVFECVIESNKGQGVDATNCKVVLRRNTIQQNPGGGVKLSDGTFDVVDNLIVKNGTSGATGSPLGGLQISPGTGTVTFYNNTIADNLAMTGAAGGIICALSTTMVVNSVLWNNTGAAQSSTCSLSQSVQAPDTSPILDAAYKPTAACNCIDKGAPVTGITTLDRLSNPRPQGVGVDIGAFEVQ